MRLYKYRSIDNLDRDLSLYSNNYFWASSKEELNDENEFTYNVQPFFEELKVYEEIAKKGLGSAESVHRVKEIAEDFFKYAKSCGVFSLSKNPNEDSMWSLYASKGEGYCLVFDSDELMKIVDDVISVQRFLLPVDYANSVPKMVSRDMNDQKLILTKILATKSKSWIKESEVRIVTDRPGKQRFLPSALIGVIFGTNTDEETKKKILAAFEDRNLEVYQLHKLENTYEYFIEPLTPLVREQELPSMSYDYVNAPSATVDNFYVKSNVPLPDVHSKKNFVKKFKHDIAERKCNIFLMDADTDLSKLTDCFHTDEEYVEEHVIAEMYFDCEDVFVE